MGTSYPFLDSIADPKLKGALKNIFDRLANAERLTSGIGTVSQPLTTHLDSRGKRLTNLGVPTAGSDAVTLDYLRRYVEGRVQDMAARTLAAADASATGKIPVDPPDPDNPNNPYAGVYEAPQTSISVPRVSGRTFVDAVGTIWKYNGCSSFRTYADYLAAGGSGGGGAAAIAPVLAERAGLGFGHLRVFSLLFNITNLWPGLYPTYFTDLPIFCAQVIAAGMVPEIVVLADCSLVPLMSTVAQQQAHLAAVAAALAGVSNVLISQGNEWQSNAWAPKTTNASYADRPVGITSSAGSSNGNEVPPQPPWDYVEDHPVRDLLWPRGAKQLLEWYDGISTYNPGAQRPCVSSEPMGAGEVNIPGSRSDVPDDFYWFAATAMLMGAGATFHSQNGIDSVPFQPVQLACATAWAAAMAAIPPEAQTWSYTRGGLTDFPLTHDETWYLKAYGKIDNNQAICVLMRPTGSWPGPVPIAPWVIDSVTGPVVGPSATLVFLSRP